MNIRRSAWMALLALSVTACGSAPRQPMDTVSYVDLERFMGDWYVIAHIPAFLEDEAHNAVESYRMNDDGTIATTYAFNDGGFDAEREVYTPTGYVRDPASNAVWGMEFIWPIKAEYLIVHLDDDYRETIIGRSARDYVWVMTREPDVAPSDYRLLADIVAELGYDPQRLRRVPQRWPGADAAVSGAVQ